MKKFYKNVKKRSIFFSLLVLSFPLFTLLPSAEPFVIGGEILFHWLSFVAILTIIIPNIITKESHLIIPTSREFKLTIIFCLYITLHSLSQKIPINITTPLAICFAGFFLTQNKQFKIFKYCLAQSISFFSLFYLFFFYLAKLDIIDVDLFGHPHFFSSWMLLIFPVTLWNILKTTKQLKYLNILIASINFYTLVSLNTSTIITLLTIVSLIIFLNYRWFHLNNLLLIVIMILALFLFILFNKDDIISSLHERLFIWKLCLTHMQYIPFFGVGLHNFESFYQSILNGYLINAPMLFEAGKTEWYEWAHNELIHCLIEYGVPGFIFVLLMFIYTIKNIIDQYNAKNDNAIYYLGLCLLIIYSLFSFPFRMPSVSLLAFIMFFQLLSEKEKKVHSTIKIPLFYKGNFIALEICIIILLLFSIITLKETYAYYSFSQGISNKSQLDIHSLQASCKYNPHSKLYTFSLGKAYIDNNYFQMAEYYFQQSANIVPATPQLFALALAKDLLNKQEQAKDLYEKIRIISPEFSPAMHNLKVLNKRMFNKSENKTIK